MNSNFKSQVASLMEGAYTIPNLLSALRIIMIPFILVFYLKGMVIPAVILLGLSGLTDLLDGKIARKFNQVSELGKILDPIADKLTQMTLAVAYFFSFHGLEGEQYTVLRGFSWIFWFYVVKELLMLLGGAALLSNNIRPTAAIMYGKVATVAYYVVMILVLLFAPEFGVLPWAMPTVVIIILVSISVVLTLIAFFAYAPDAVRQLKEKKATNENKE